MQCCYDPLLILCFKGVFLDGHIALHDKIDCVVWFALSEDTRSLWIAPLIQEAVDKLKFLIGKAAEHAVLAEKSIVYRTFTHR